MKCGIQIILLLFSLFSFSQTDPISKIGKASTVSFVSDNSGCFGGEIIEYKLVKTKNGGRTVTIIKKDGKAEIKKLSSKNYAGFVSNFRASYNKFKDPESVKQTCTSVSLFFLSDSKNKIKFSNVTCEAEYNPEMFLQNLFRANEGTKK